MKQFTLEKLAELRNEQRRIDTLRPKYRRRLIRKMARQLNVPLIQDTSELKKKIETALNRAEDAVQLERLLKELNVKELREGIKIQYCWPKSRVKWRCEVKKVDLYCMVTIYITDPDYEVYGIKIPKQSMERRKRVRPGRLTR